MKITRSFVSTIKLPEAKAWTLRWPIVYKDPHQIYHLVPVTTYFLSSLQKCISEVPRPILQTVFREIKEVMSVHSFTMNWNIIRSAHNWLCVYNNPFSIFKDGNSLSLFYFFQKHNGETKSKLPSNLFRSTQRFVFLFPFFYDYAMVYQHYIKTTSPYICEFQKR